MTTVGAILLQRMLDGLGRKDKKPWEDRKNYRLAASPFRSKCHVWRNEQESATVRLAVWQDKNQSLRRNQCLIPACGRQHCVQYSHQKVVTDKQRRQIAELRKKRRNCTAEEVKELAAELGWEKAEIAAVLGLSKEWSK